MPECEIKKEETPQETLPGGEAPEEEPVKFSVNPPNGFQNLSEASIDKIVEHLAKGSYVIDKYVEGVKLAHNILMKYYPDSCSSEECEKSLEILSNFRSTLAEEKASIANDEVKKIFAYHLETCNSAMSPLFSESMDTNDVTVEESELNNLVKKFPKVTMKNVREISQLTNPVFRQRGKILEDIKNVCEEMDAMDAAFITDMLKFSEQREQEVWSFLTGNKDKVVQYFDQFGPSEVVALSSYKCEVDVVLKKMADCQKNWSVAGAHLEKKTSSPSCLVLGPALDEIDNPNDLAIEAPSTRAALSQSIDDCRKKIDNVSPNVVSVIKDALQPEDQASYNYIFDYVPTVLAKGPSKPLVPEEKVYVGYHLSKVKAIAGKISNMGWAKRVLTGQFVFRESNRGRFRGGRW